MSNLRSWPVVVALALAGCVEDAEGVSASAETLSSDVGTFVDLQIDAELDTSSSTSPTTLARQQLLFMIGQLNGVHAVARMDKIAISNVTTMSVGGALVRVKYHAKFPVAWSAAFVPATFSFILPRNQDPAPQAAFFAQYSASCSDGEPGLTADSYYVHYRPSRAGCSIYSGDVVTAPASKSPSSPITSTKYPEYDRVWQDHALRVVAVFAKQQQGATSASDAGIAAYNAFLASVAAQFPGATTTPPALPPGPGASAPDVTFDVALPGGDSVQVVALLADSVVAPPPAWATRLGNVTRTADLVIHAGSAENGAAVRSLVRLYKFAAAQYQIFFFDSSDSFAYVDGELARARAAYNPSDLTGTKFMEVVSNAMPVSFAQMNGGAMAFVRALANRTQPKRYVTILHDIDAAQVAVVAGEEDNTYAPPAIGPTPQ